MVMFILLMVLSMLKPQDGAMVSVLLSIFPLGMVLPQVLFVVGKQEAQISSYP